MKKNNIKESLIKFRDFIITPPNPKENIFQYIMRYFLLTDSKGNPSWTITILAYVLTLVGFVCYKEFQLAGMYNLTFQDGKLLTQTVIGFSSQFYYLIILLAGLIVFFFKSRGDNNRKKSEKENNEVQKTDDSSLLSGVVEQVKNTIDNFTNKK
jgi:preprotein translocase subunit YajC